MGVTDGRVIITLRPVAEKDFVAYAQAFVDDPDLANLLGFEDVPQPGAAHPGEVEWAIADAETDEFLGSITLHSVDRKHRRGETRFWVVAAARGHGALSEALAQVLDYCFGEAGLERMELTALPENKVVPLIAEKFGYAFEGTLRKRNFERGRRVDLLIWGLLADERPARESTPR
ncbi:MAG TPA: GNAT family protein [Casimicrobiaceae bacterium]|nr:GNAT family protein [Casimicrobiaceae bacterium]